MHPWVVSTLAVVGNATVVISIQVFVLIPGYGSSGHTPMSGIADSCSNSMFHFLKTPKLFSLMAALFYIPTSSRQGS